MEDIQILKNELDNMIEKFNNGEKMTGLQNKIDQAVKSIDELDKKYTDKLNFNDNKRSILHNELKKMNLEGRLDHKIILKNEASTILQPDYFGVIGGGGHFTPGQLETDRIGQTPFRQLTILDFIQMGSSSSNYVEWYEVSGATDSVAVRAEGSTMALSDVKYIKRFVESKIISEYFVATRESLKDIPMLEGEIRDRIFKQIKVYLEDQVLKGTGDNNQMLGITGYATAFTAAGKWVTSTGVTLPNIYDAMLACIAQINYAGTGTWMPNAIFIHPRDYYYYGFSDLKISTGEYITVPFRNGNSVMNVQIVPSMAITEGKLLVGDFTKAKLFIVDDLEVRVWDQNSTDPIYNRISITGNMRAILRVMNSDKGAFVYDDISDIIAQITAA